MNEDGHGVEIWKTFPPSSTDITISSIRSDTPVGSKTAKEQRVSFKVGSFHYPIIWVGRKYSGEISLSPEGISDSIISSFSSQEEKFVGMIYLISNELYGIRII